MSPDPLRYHLQTTDMQQTEVVVFGAAHIDLEARLQGPFHSGASNPVDVRRTLGGVGANVALASCRSATTSLCTITGSDADGNAITTALREAGVVVDVIHSTVSSGFYLALLDMQGHLQHGLANTALMELADSEKITTSLAKCKDVRIIAFDCNLSSAAINTICNHPFADSTRPLLAAIAVSPMKTNRLKIALEKLDFLFCNREELAALTNASDNLPLQELAEHVNSMGVKTVIATDSNHPLVVVEESASHSISIPTTAASFSGSVNGAGDSLAGAVIAQLAKGTDVVAAIKQQGLAAALLLLETGKPQV